MLLLHYKFLFFFLSNLNIIQPTLSIYSFSRGTLHYLAQIGAYSFRPTGIHWDSREVAFREINSRRSRISSRYRPYFMQVDYPNARCGTFSLRIKEPRKRFLVGISVIPLPKIDGAILTGRVHPPFVPLSTVSFSKYRQK